MDGKSMEKHKGNKKKGSFYEYKFFSEAMKRGYEIFVPAGDHLPQDCHLVNTNDEVFRIQIKGTSSQYREAKTPRYRITAKVGSKKKGCQIISCDKVDFLAAYVENLDIFYIVPCDKISATNVWLYPDAKNSKGRFEKYKEDWSVFD